MKDIRGLQRHQEQRQSQLIRDTRTTGQKLADLVKNPTAMGILFAMMAVASFMLPGLADLLLIGGVIVFMAVLSHKATLPFRLPQRAKIFDYNDPKPGSGKPNMARGIYFFGNEQKTNRELWFSNTDMRTHVLIFGSTGSGKTETLISLAYNAVLQGSGFIYVDGKGDNALFSRVFAMVRYMGREDDLLLINFMTGAKDIIGPQKYRLSNTLNPFARGSSSMLSQLVVSLMASSQNSGDGDMWKNRAINFVESLMKILVAMRDGGYIRLDANTIRNYFDLGRLESMVLDKVFIRDDDEPVKIDWLPASVLEPLKSYVYNLPGFNPERKGKQVSQVWEQHGFITMQLVRTFSSLADTYGHILRTELAEVDLPDVVLNRRILLALLPALEKSPDELSNLGKVIIASLKAMMAAGLGESVEGEHHELIERKPTNADTPYLCILDEYGYYAVEGFAVVPAQARSLGFSVVFAGQDLPAFQKASKEEAQSIGANTNIKICMKLEDPSETWEFFQKTAGESYVAHVSGFQTDTQSMTGNYRDTQSAQMEKRARVDLLDLKEQAEGEMHIFFKSEIIRANSFYANPKPVKRMRLNHFLKVGQPEDRELETVLNNISKIQNILDMDEELFADAEELEPELQTVTEGIHRDTSISPLDRGVNGLMAMNESEEETYEEPLPYEEGGFEEQPSVTDETEQPPSDQPSSEAETEPEAEQPSKTTQKTTAIPTQADKGFLDIFTPLQLSDDLYNTLVVRNKDAYSEPLLVRDEITKQAEYIERLSGYSNADSKEMVKETFDDMESSTFYPPYVQDLPGAKDVAEVASRLAEKIREVTQSSSE